MAEGDGTVYNNAKEQLLLKVLDFANDTFKVMLVTGHSPDIDAHAVYADVSGDEESGTGYVAGGDALVGQAVTQENTPDQGKFDATDTTWSGLDVGTPSHAILYDTSASNYLIGYWELGRASNGGNYTLQYNSSGVLTIS